MCTLHTFNKCIQNGKSTSSTIRPTKDTKEKVNPYALFWSQMDNNEGQEYYAHQKTQSSLLLS